MERHPQSTNKGIRRSFPASNASVNSPTGGPVQSLLLTTGRPHQRESHARSVVLRILSASRPILVGVPRNGETIRELGRELMAYDQIRRSRSELENDAVARRELDARTADVRLRLEEELRDALLNIQWIDMDASGQDPKTGAGAAGTLSHLASRFADEVFGSTPHAFSELINRDAPSSNSIKARKDLLYAMLRHGDEDRLGLKGSPGDATRQGRAPGDSRQARNAPS